MPSAADEGRDGANQPYDQEQGEDQLRREPELGGRKLGHKPRDTWVPRGWQKLAGPLEDYQPPG